MKQSYWSCILQRHYQMNIRTPSTRLNRIGLAFSLHWICTQESSSKNINNVCAYTNILREICAKFYAWIPRFDSISLICASSQDCLQMYCILWWKEASFWLKWDVHSVDRDLYPVRRRRKAFSCLSMYLVLADWAIPYMSKLYRRACTAMSFFKFPDEVKVSERGRIVTGK